MLTATTTKKMTLEEFEEYVATHDGRCELIDGEVQLMSPTNYRHGILVHRFSRAVGNFVADHDLGVVLAGEPGFITNPDPQKPSVRAPDVAFIRKERAPGRETRGFAPVAPDLCVEVLSPSDGASEVLRKVAMWLEFGARLVWVADDESRTVTAYGPGGRARVYRDTDTLDGGEVLPGFALPLRELFA